jgi:hypothetical protein
VAALIFAARRAAGDTAPQAWAYVADNLTPENRRAPGTWSDAAKPYREWARAEVAGLREAYEAATAEATALDREAMARSDSARAATLRALKDSPTARADVARTFEAFIRAPSLPGAHAVREALRAWRRQVTGGT